MRSVVMMVWLELMNSGERLFVVMCVSGSVKENVVMLSVFYYSFVCGDSIVDCNVIMLLLVFMS